MRPLVPLIVASSVSWARTCSGSSDRLSFVPEKPTTCTEAPGTLQRYPMSRFPSCSLSAMMSGAGMRVSLRGAGCMPSQTLFLPCARRSVSGFPGTAWSREGRYMFQARTQWRLS